MWFVLCYNAREREQKQVCATWSDSALKRKSYVSKRGATFGFVCTYQVVCRCKCLCVREEKAAMIHWKLVETYGKGCVNDSTVCHWLQVFWEGRTKLADEQQSW